MALSTKRRAQLVAANQLEYGERYAALDFPGQQQLDRLRQRRSELLQTISLTGEIGAAGTKLDMRRLSPGCRSCVAGGWSCLFINGRCNGRCFYCPTDQQQLGLPMTNSLTFRHPADYVRYLERFDFNGASISGGEPLLTPNRSRAFIGAVKRHFGAAVHSWLYTNGTLLNEDLLLQLRDAGLDEIRFDIGATAYNLKKLKLAIGVIPTVTIEIPAIPQETGRLKQLLPELVAAGVKHLNLHQLRLTPYNYQQLQPRGYQYLHGDKVTVIDSELAALEIAAYGFEQGIDLPVNYCSFVYKNRFQGQAARLRNAQEILKPYEQISDNGYLRVLTLCGSAAAISARLETFIAAGQSAELWSRSRSGEQLSIHPSLWPQLDSDGLTLRIDYFYARQLPSISYRNPFTSIKLSERQTIHIERNRACASLELDAPQAELFARTFILRTASANDVPETELWQTIRGFEQITEGFQEYFAAD